MKPRKQLEFCQCRFPSEMRFERTAISIATDFAARLALSDERVEGIRTGVSEAFINAVEHASREESSGRIELSLRSTGEDTMQIVVHDWGPTFNPEQIEAPKIEQKIQAGQKKRGWGLYLIRQLADDVRIHSSKEKGNIVEMIFSIKEH